VCFQATKFLHRMRRRWDMRKELIRGKTTRCNRQEEDEAILRQTEVRREWRARASSGGKISSDELSGCAALVLKTRVLGKAPLYVADKRTTAFSHIWVLLHENLQLRPRRCCGCALFGRNLADWEWNADKTLVICWNVGFNLDPDRTPYKKKKKQQAAASCSSSISIINQIFVRVKFLALSESASYLTSHSNFVSREKFLWDSLSFFFKELDASCIEAFSFRGGQKLSWNLQLLQSKRRYCLVLIRQKFFPVTGVSICLFVCSQAPCNNYSRMYALCFLFSSSRLLSPFAFSIQQAFNQTKNRMQVFSSSSSSSSLCSCNSLNTWAYLRFCRIGSFSILLSLPCLSKLINWLEFSCVVSQLPTNCDNTVYLGSFDTTYIFLSNTKIGILGKSIYLH
jgi:hypothetical protein